MSQLVGMASGEYRHHLVTIWPLPQPGLTPPPRACLPSSLTLPYAMPYLYVKRPPKRELWFLGGLWE